MASGDHYQHPSTWGNPRAEQVLHRLHRLHVPEVSARTMRKRLRDVPAARPPDFPPSATLGGTPRPRRSPEALVDQRDWRWFVGGLGKVLISLGILIFAFVAYQLWGTGIQYARAQDQLSARFDDQLAQLPTPAPLPPTTLAQIGPSATDPTATDPTATDPTATDPTTPTAEPPDTTVPASIVELPPVTLGDVLGRIEIPSIGVNDMIVAGVRQSDLDEGVGHYPYTPFPGDEGNAAIAGHRTTHGQPFFDLDKLTPGDEIVVTTLEGRFVYAVTDSKVVDPSDFTVLLSEPGVSELTLTTCHPRYSQKKRLVVAAVLDTDRSAAAATQISYADDALDAVESADAAPSDTIVGGAPAIADANGAVANLGTGATADAFADGWFSDPAAWPQIALWGAALTVVALAATWLGRRSRNWIGALVGIAPFTFLLYFFFENVNRLMPPGL